MRNRRRMFVVALLFSTALTGCGSRELPPIRIGAIHSLTGTMATSERALVDAVQLAVEELNANGGVLGRRVDVLVVDSRSDDRVAAAEAERLIVQEKVSALFACWTSACRKAVKPVVERHRHLMFYPVQYEGLEQSPHICYTGSAPNQQIMPGTRWALDHLGKRVYLLGSDYVYPRVANRIIRDHVVMNGGTVLAERYRPLGESDFAAIAEELRALKPDVVFNNINGDSNLSFFRALRDAGLGDLPVVSFSVAEEEAQAIGTQAFHSNHYAVWDYFQSLPGEANQRFVAAFRSRFGARRLTSAPVEAAYVGVHLWAQAVDDVRTEAPDQVISAVARQSIAGPAGVTAVDRGTRHLWKRVLVGKARADGQFDIVWDFGDIVRPRPYPDYRSLAAWKALAGEMSEPRP